jgi:hypothetical protein
MSPLEAFVTIFVTVTVCMTGLVAWVAWLRCTYEGEEKK